MPCVRGRTESLTRATEYVFHGKALLSAYAPTLRELPWQPGCVRTKWPWRDPT